MKTPADEGLEALKERASDAAELLRLLANPTRLLLLCQIARGECSVAELERDLGLRQPGLSQQLAELRQNQLVKTRRESRSIYYSLADARVQVLLEALHEALCGDPSLSPVQEPTDGGGREYGESARFAQVMR
ncbi:TPA: ArsR/SmtB family transcription factor [Pseudomonas aeruginosa]|nr:winged helix-turn-helix transcriptional regulator [Pseudomonas aeruginosa]